MFKIITLMHFLKTLLVYSKWYDYRFKP